MDRAALLRVARGQDPADLVLAGATIVNVLSGEIYPADVAIADGLIAGVGSGYKGREQIDLQGLTLMPGLIESHIHIESTMPITVTHSIQPRTVASKPNQRPMNRNQRMRAGSATPRCRSTTTNGNGAFTVMLLIVFWKVCCHVFQVASPGRADAPGNPAGPGKPTGPPFSCLAIQPGTPGPSHGEPGCWTEPGYGDA